MIVLAAVIVLMLATTVVCIALGAAAKRGDHALEHRPLAPVIELDLSRERRRQVARRRGGVA